VRQRLRLSLRPLLVPLAFLALLLVAVAWRDGSAAAGLPSWQFGGTVLLLAGLQFLSMREFRAYLRARQAKGFGD
jgi:hypothetical protein